jgi:hypothetical protein
MARTFPLRETSESTRRTVRLRRHPSLAQIKAIVDENDHWHAELDMEEQAHALELQRVTDFREQQKCDATPSSIPEDPARELDKLEEHAVIIARYSEAILTTLRTLMGTIGGTRVDCVIVSWILMVVVILLRGPVLHPERFSMNYGSGGP